MIVRSTIIAALLIGSVSGCARSASSATEPTQANPQPQADRSGVVAADSTAEKKGADSNESTDPKTPEKVKTELIVAEVAGVWKAKILIIKGKHMLIENLDLTIQADGKGKVVYRVNQGGGQFNVTFSEVMVKQDKTKDKSGKESSYIALSGFAAMEWIVSLKGKNELELFGAVPTADGPSIETLILGKDSADPKKEPPK